MLLVLKQLFAKNPFGRLIIIRGLRYSAMINNSTAAALYGSAGCGKNDDGEWCCSPP